MKKSLLAAALLSCTMAAQAADQNDASSLSPVIVTATRTAITADEALSSVTVITRADIERLQPLSVPDLLAGLPGVSFANTGGYGQQTSLFMRGTNSTHTLLLVDAKGHRELGSADKLTLARQLIEDIAHRLSA